MSIENLETQLFQEIMQEHLIQMIEYLFNANQEFGIVCEIKEVSFTPTLPKDIADSLHEITLFRLENYSFESANINDDFLSFEAGFGTEPVGALVEIPVLAIKQIFVDEYPILMNVASSGIGTQETTVEVDSMSALLNNPENAKLLKKSK